MNYLITGATGFIGVNLVNRLIHEGNNVIVLTRSKELSDSSLISEGVLIYNYSIVEEIYSCFQKTSPDVVIHLASFYVANHNSSNIVELIDANVKFGTIILEAAAQSSCRNVIITGTNWQNFNNEFFNPVNLYAATKQAFSDIAKYYSLSANFKVMELKLPDTYGPYDTRPKVFNVLLEHITMDWYLELSGGDQYLDMVHIDDVVEGFVRAAKILSENKEACFLQYSLYSAASITLRELVDIFTQKLGYKLLVKYGSKPYRHREIFEPISFNPVLPGWNPKIDLITGIESILKQKYRF